VPSTGPTNGLPISIFGSNFSVSYADVLVTLDDIELTVWGGGGAGLFIPCSCYFDHFYPLENSPYLQEKK
jgi:hypothetical protein